MFTLTPSLLITHTQTLSWPTIENFVCQKSLFLANLDKSFDTFGKLGKQKVAHCLPNNFREKKYSN